MTLATIHQLGLLSQSAYAVLGHACRRDFPVAEREDLARRAQGLAEAYAEAIAALEAERASEADSAFEVIPWAAWELPRVVAVDPPESPSFFAPLTAVPRDARVRAVEVESPSAELRRSTWRVREALALLLGWVVAFVGWR